MPNNTIPQDGAIKLMGDLKFEIQNLNDRIKSQGISGVALEQLNNNKNELQNLLNQFLLKKNVITEKEYDDAYEQLRTSRKRSLQIDFSKSKIPFYVIGGVLVVGLIYYYYKKYKK